MTMTQSIQPALRHLVLVGGGHAQVAVLKNLAMNPINGLRITLISRDTMTPYSGMLPGFLEGVYRADEIVIDLSHLARMAGARFIAGEVTAIDPDARSVTVKGRPPMHYDLLSLNIGSNTDTGAIKGAARFGIPVKPISTLLDRLDPVLKKSGTPKRIAIVGGGAAGVEVAFALQARLPQNDYTLISRNRRLVAEYPEKASRFLLDELKRKKVSVHLGRGAAEIAKDKIILDDGTTIATDITLLVTPGAAPGWVAKCGLELDDKGFIKTASTLEAVGHKDILVSGDIAALSSPRPKAGVFAVRAGRHLASNIRRKLLGQSPKAWKPQSDYLALIGMGNRQAYGVRGGMGFNLGRPGWWWKEYIDRKFMDRFAPVAMDKMKTPKRVHALPDVPPVPEMRCLGCGAKAGYDTLDAALDRAATYAKKHFPEYKMQSSIARDSAEIKCSPAMLQSVDALSAIVDDAFLLGRITANHALSDLYASNAKPTSALALITIPAASPRLAEDDLTQMLAGALAAFAEDNVPLVGGHSSQSHSGDMQIGFAVTGAPMKTAKPRKLQDGDVLVLTKPLGIGVIMAAHGAGAAIATGTMRNRAIDIMAASNRAAAEILSGAGSVKAMTDVTGFGLARHALNLLERDTGDGKDFSIHFDADSLPLIDGVQFLIDAGHKSSIADENEAATGIAQLPAICADPQTGGGLLAIIPQKNLTTTLAAFKKARLPLWPVGRLVKDGEQTVRCD